MALVESIHASPTQLVIAVTGGGHAVITDLLAVAGASATMLEAIVPYSAASLDQLVSGEASASGAVSAATATAMARSCLERAQHLAPDAKQLLGVACTATIATNRQKRGEHRGHIAIVDSTNAVNVAEIVPLTKGQLSRIEEDQTIADEILHHLAATVSDTQ